MEALAIPIHEEPTEDGKGPRCDRCAGYEALRREENRRLREALADLSAARTDRDAAHAACAEAQTENVVLRGRIADDLALIERMRQANDGLAREAAQIALQRDELRVLLESSEQHRLDLTREIEAYRRLPAVEAYRNSPPPEEG